MGFEEDLDMFRHIERPLAIKLKMLKELNEHDEHYYVFLATEGRRVWDDEKGDYIQNPNPNSGFVPKRKVRKKILKGIRKELKEIYENEDQLFHELLHEACRFCQYVKRKYGRFLEYNFDIYDLQVKEISNGLEDEIETFKDKIEALEDEIEALKD